MKDLKALLEFEQGVIVAERPFDPTLKVGDTAYYDIKELITADHIQMLVVTIGGEIIGSGYARIEKAKPYLSHQSFAYLGFMFVKIEYRGRGINKLIIEGLKDWCISRNIEELRLEVYDQNLSAIKAYAKVGFEKHMITMRMSIAP